MKTWTDQTLLLGFVLWRVRGPVAHAFDSHVRLSYCALLFEDPLLLLRDPCRPHLLATHNHWFPGG